MRTEELGLHNCSRLGTLQHLTVGGVNSVGVVSSYMPSPVPERYKARVYGRSHAGIAGSNSASGMDGCPL
jgi:hypothetical protein